MSAPDQLLGHMAPALIELFKSAIGRPDVYANNAMMSAKISDIRLGVENVISTVLSARNEALGRPLDTMALPNDTLTELIKAVIAHVYADNARVSARISDIRRCVGNVISTVLSARNEALGRPLMTLPNEVLLLIFEHLPAQDVFSTSRVCRRLRAVTLSSSQLWTQLEIHAHTGEDGAEAYLNGKDSYNDWIVSNMTLVQSLLDRSKDKLLSLNVTVATESEESDIPGEFIDQLKSFLASVSHRLQALHIRIDCESDLLDALFHAQRWAFPQLCELAVSASYEAYRSRIELDLGRTLLPRLAHLELCKDFDIKDLPPLPTLKVFSCDGAQIHDIMRILAHARGLERLGFGLKDAVHCSFEAAQRDQEFVSALNAVPAVVLRANVTGGERCSAICSFVDLLPRPSLGLDLVIGGYPPPICLRCDRVLSATQIVMLDSPKSIDVVVTDTSGRTTTVRVFDELTSYINPRGEHTQPLDWSGIPLLELLTSLRVDASIWRLVMAGFPRAPLLAHTTLSLNDVSSLDSVRSPVELAVTLDHGDGFTPAEALGVPQALLALGADVHFEEDQSVRPVPPVPAGTSLTIASDDPVSIDGWCVGDVMELLGVDEVKLDGVVLEGDRAFAACALSGIMLARFTTPATCTG